MRNLKLSLLRVLVNQVYGKIVGRTPDVKNVATVPDVAYVEDGLDWHKLDVYSPVSHPETLPAVIYIHGGGWSIADKRQFRHFCQAIAAGGYVVFNVNYRLAPDYSHPAQLADVLSAMAWVKSHARRYAANPAEVFLGGDSAGAHLAALAACVCTNPDLEDFYRIPAPFTEKEIRGCILFCGTYDLRTSLNTSFPLIRDFVQALLGTRDLEQVPDLDRLAPTKNITPRFPPCLVSDSVKDALIGESRTLIRLLDQNGVKHSDLLFEDVGRASAHDYQIESDKPIFDRCIKECLAFLAEDRS
ncbi:esterase/lipase [Longilinea arvoryzae]|uniref:Esterase/lipase n=1 Tax=Longilinea arvoryzae TaxID=360412 RepID=A0A0S7BD19_9CHLR|nr:alpha/beta hydrolase [Longilinea arvoryzae]GAP15788.1 esterase/lipase [Longilinea arvoryzae]